MQKPVDQLRRTGPPRWAAQLHLALRADQRRFAYRTDRRRLDDLDIGRTLIERNANHLRDHVACTTHPYHVTNAHAEALDLIHVVKRGVGNRDPTHEHGVQPSDRRHGSGATHLVIHPRSLVRASSAAGLKAMAQRGVRVSTPSLS